MLLSIGRINYYTKWIINNFKCKIT